MASVPTNKRELQLAIQLVFDKILVDYESIPADLSRTLGVEGNVKGTEISVSDTLAYLIGWGKLVIKWQRLSSANEPVDFPETGYKWNELGKLAQRFHDEYRDWNYGDLLSEFKQTVNEVLSLIDSLSDHQLYGLAWYQKYTLGRMIQFNTSSPMKNMRAKVRKFKKNKGVI
ncbi:ClbS/DfsB family four-helix bundle protein [Paraglaciecola arctica]|uniref:ClbS/DfsB family four-helix bundle protein n=1 Tax=Paraglaciecola arctica TaxID=1128911 RepID=UPI001C07991F|nr:ClbS/DfsB family four-helix bundle protein [Paraglaciecola arctica]MBU3003116.1 ClbS/DfsB family four-helix bundle protein [Paraglaciecola arctica]